MARTARTQPATQSQRPGTSRRRRLESDEEEAEEMVMAEGSQEEDAGGNDDIQRKANDLVRLALFNEARRMPLRRDEITKKVLHNSRNFKQVFDKAQQTLDRIFGMELVELPSKAGMDQEAAAAANTQKNGKEDGTQRPRGTQAQAAADEEAQLEEARKGATSVRKKAAALGSKMYILRSILDPNLIELAMKTDADILAEEAMLDFSSGDFFGNDAGGGGGGRGGHGGGGRVRILDDDDDEEEDWNDDDDGTEMQPKTYGSILSWTQTDQLANMGVLYVILSLILVNGRVIDEGLLRRQLKELGLPSSDRLPIHYTTLSTQRSIKLDDYLSILLRQGYLDRQIVGELGSAGRKRARGKVGKASGTGDGDGGNGESYEWRWGVRALCEVGEDDMTRWMAELMTGSGNLNLGDALSGRGGGEDDDEEGEDQEGRSKAKVKKMYGGIEKAAGGHLVGVRNLR